VLVHDGVRIMAAGLPALAGLLEDRGYPAQVWDLHGERLAGLPPLSSRDLQGVRVLAVSIHWFDQLPASIGLAAAAREAGFDGAIVAGGITASCFAEELVRRHPQLDAVIQGDGERPLLELADALDASTARLDRVPNLVWRDTDGTVRDNGLTYAGGAEEVDALDFARLDTIRHLDHYQAASSWRAITDGSPGLRADLSSTCYLCGGRGCSVDCVTCGGGRSAHASHSGRDRFCFRSPARLADDVESALQLGFTSIHACFDPAPNGEHWTRFMEEVDRRGISTTMIFESFSLPDEAFLRRFSRTFESGIVVLSPGTGDEEVRRRTRGLWFSDEDLWRTLERIGALGLQAQVFFGYFSPAADDDEIYATRRRARELTRRFGDHAEVLHLPYSTDPMSPLARDPAAYECRSSVTTAADYLRELARLEPWLDNLLRHTPRAGEPAQWRAVTLGVELEKACGRDDPALYAALVRRTGDGIDRFFHGLARRLLAALPERALQRDRLAAVVRTYAGELA